MNRTLLALTGLLTFLLSSTAMAQECPDGLFSYVQVDERGNGVRVCAKSTRQTTQAVAAIGSLDSGRNVSTSVTPSSASAHLSASYGPVGMGGPPAYGFYPAPDDPRQAWGLRDAVLDGVQVTASERSFQDAADNGIRDGQHRQVMERLDELEATLLARIAELERNLRAAIAVGNKDLERKFQAQLEDCKAQLAKTKTPTITDTIPSKKKEDENSEEQVEEPPPPKLAPCPYALTQPDKCRTQPTLVGKK